MADTIIHVPPETHAAFKAQCQARGLQMREVVGRLIGDWLEPTQVKKRLQGLEGNPGADAYSKPPFWATG